MRLIPGPHTFALDLVLPDGAILAADPGTFTAEAMSGATFVTTPRVQPLEALATFTAEVAPGASTLAVTGTARYALNDRTHEAPFEHTVALTGAPDGEAAPDALTIALA